MNLILAHMFGFGLAAVAAGWMLMVIETKVTVLELLIVTELASLFIYFAILKGLTI